LKQKEKRNVIKILQDTGSAGSLKYREWLTPNQQQYKRAEVADVWITDLREDRPKPSLSVHHSQ
jgi:hypothetical protein